MTTTTYIYKIRHKVTGLFSKGGSYPSWSKAGKVWKKKGDLSTHLSQSSNPYDDAEIVAYEIVQTETEMLSIEEWRAQLDERRDVRLAKERKARAAYQLEVARKNLAREVESYQKLVKELS